MTDPAPQQAKQKPRRRRPGAGSRQPNPKDGASENDVAKADPSLPSEVAQSQSTGNNSQNGIPRTPQKSQNGSAAVGKSTGKPANRNNKKQQSNKTDSPAVTKSGRRTPPRTAGPKTAGPAVSAFAGATFHASPAPSSLPLPSFFTKASSPGTPRARPASGLGQQLSPPATGARASSATAAIAADGLMATTDSGRNPLFPAAGAKVPLPRDESPLDLLFRVDRAEKERNRRASSANLYGASGGPFHPPFASQAAEEDVACNHTSPRNGHQRQYQQDHSVRQPGSALHPSSPGISAAELDGTPGRPMGPAFATPFQDRIRAARPTGHRTPLETAGTVAPVGFRDIAAGPASSSSAGMHSNQPTTTASVDDRSEALKRFLFSKTGAAATSHSGTSPASAPTTPTRYAGTPGYAQQPSPFGGKSYPNMDHASPAPRAPSHQGYTNGFVPTDTIRQSGNSGTPMNISAMEDSLRQILKLDSSFGGVTPSGIRR
ncbi:hypothetical protein SEPCBS119000_006168 [Sporothrix epigloea]|uniref:Proteophosphoglycan 5 n=1 Tax=Sporothrix epigloea TaxID=1892477 RepID=A0ABP0E1W1_9PEZI